MTSDGLARQRVRVMRCRFRTRPAGRSMKSGSYDTGDPQELDDVHGGAAQDGTFGLNSDGTPESGVYRLNRTKGDWHRDTPADRSRVVTSDRSARSCCAETNDSGDSPGGASADAG